MPVLDICGLKSTAEYITFLAGGHFQYRRFLLAHKSSLILELRVPMAISAFVDFLRSTVTNLKFSSGDAKITTKKEIS